MQGAEVAVGEKLASDVDDGAPKVGTLLEGRYRLLGRLGEGGVGWVYRAEHLKLGHQVAIKMLQAPYSHHELVLPRFEREAKALAALQHPNIVKLVDYSVADGRPYLVMELLEGQTLGALIRSGRIPFARTRRVMLQVLDALIFAHERGFAHRDLKPGNIFLVDLPTEHDHVKVLDFGFVKLLGGESEPSGQPGLTRSGIAFGTPAYMSPEQATGAPTDPRADVYAIGVILFEMLAGRRPYVGDIPDVIRQHLTAPVPPLDADSAGEHGEIQALVNKAMAKEPFDRYQSVRDLKASLLAVAEPTVGAEVALSGHRPTTPRRYPSQGGESTSLPAKASPATPWLALTVGLSAAGIAAAVTLALPPTSQPGSARPADEAGLRPANEAEPIPAGGDANPNAETQPAEASAPAGGSAAPPEAAATRESAGRSTPSDAQPAGETAAPSTGTDTGIGDGPSADAAQRQGGAGEEASADVAPPDASRLAGLGENPWDVLPPEPVFQPGLRALAAGRPLPASEERAVKAFVRGHRDDPRPHLLLGACYLLRGKRRAALSRYDLAQRVSSHARADPQMLRDLVRLAAYETTAEGAAELLEQVYGSAAIDEAERALRESRWTPAETERLRSLVARLTP